MSYSKKQEAEALGQCEYSKGRNRKTEFSRPAWATQ